ncbi:MAG TPA: DNA-binding protein, partial [Burkholderiaceae bacterium]
MEYTFTLKYQLAEHDSDADALVERLGEAGCDDALVGIGQPGRLALEFTREAKSAKAAVRSALADVKRAVPSAKLVEAVPDFVGL